MLRLRRDSAHAAVPDGLLTSLSLSLTQYLPLLSNTASEYVVGNLNLMGLKPKNCFSLRYF